ncbi:hypothetical protein DSO57_1039277 [Entomophthora muscae]|uniref:Uncharacterized protein n=1 Tax=Entomophthora muscae TaxID=34485 RepID=A0ACC2T9H9_9FUNG|nr:hypothetical protein DSO57_1039277 [Entomophthora muscae]
MSRFTSDNPFSGPLEDGASIHSRSDPFNSTSNVSLSPQAYQHQNQISQNPQEADFAENIKNLRELFPTVDAEIVEVLLQNNQNQFEKTLNELLALSDPSYIPPTTNSLAIDPQTQNQVLSDEEYAKALQDQETGIQTDQSKADEDYARAILAAEQGHLEDIENLRSLSLYDSAGSGNDPSYRRQEPANEGSSSSLVNLVEKSKRKLIGIFGKNKDSGQTSIPEQPTSPLNPNTSRRQSNPYSDDDERHLSNQFNNFDVQQEVRLERRCASPIQSGQEFHKRTELSSPPVLIDLLGDDPPEMMNPIAPVSHISSNNSFPVSRANENTVISTGVHQSQAWQIPNQSTAVPQPNQSSSFSPERSNNPFMTDDFGAGHVSSNSAKPAASRNLNPFE